MFRLKALLAASILASQPVLAADLDQTTFKADGLNFEYTTTLSHGAVVIQGRVVESREPFSFLVNKYGQVSGFFGSSDVEFKVSPEARDRLFARFRGDLASAR